MNAGTAEDQTTYFYSFPSNRIELWFLLESERFLHPVFREFYKERDVVREERRMRIESSPQGQLVEALDATAFEAHPYKNSPAGWASDIESLRATDAEAFYKRYYGPSNLTIGIAGDVNPAEAKKLAEKYFGPIPARPAPPLVDTVEPPQNGEKRVMVASPAQPFLVIAYKRPDQYSKDNAALDVLEQILSGGRTSIIYKEMVRDKKIALGAASYATYPGGKYPSLFLFFVVPNSGHTVDEMEKSVYEIVDRVKKEKPDAEALQRVKINLRAALIQKLDSNSGLAAELCAYQARIRRLAQTVHRARRIQSSDRGGRPARRAEVSAGEHSHGGVYVRALLRKPQGRREMKRLTLFLAILTAGVVVAQEAPKPVYGPPSYKSLKYPPLPQVKIPEPVEVTLSNGMRVLLLEDHELPLIRGLALIRTGNLFDPSDKHGLSQVMADVLRSGGTKSKTGDQIDEELENIAGSVEAGMDETSASVSFSGLKETTDQVLAVFKDVLTNPEFRQDKLDLTLTQYRSAIARRNDDASDIPGRELTRILYGKDTPYGWQPEYADLARIHREDLIAFYQRYYFPKNIMLAVYGDFTAADMKDKLEKLFADWKVRAACRRRRFRR